MVSVHCSAANIYVEKPRLDNPIWNCLWCFECRKNWLSDLKSIFIWWRMSKRFYECILVKSSSKHTRTGRKKYFRWERSLAERWSPSALWPTDDYWLTVLIRATWLADWTTLSNYRLKVWSARSGDRIYLYWLWDSDPGNEHYEWLATYDAVSKPQVLGKIRWIDQ